MNKTKLAIITMAVVAVQAAQAGGISTNTNMSVAFDRTLSHDAVIAIDGVYFNPAGVVYLNQGYHLSLNWQYVKQQRQIDNVYYPLFTHNTENPTANRSFHGHATAPVLPSIQFALNRGKLSYQAAVGVGGGGGKCTFDNGLGSFEKIVSETALAASTLAQAVDAGLGIPMFSTTQAFGKEGTYSAKSFMRGRQYYYGLSVGAAYKFNENVSAFAGVRGVYALCNYYGYVRDIKVGNMPLYQVLDPTKTGSADIELNSDQSGIGFTPILSIDYKTGRWNFAAKYEFKTRLRLKSTSVNQFPSIGNLSGNLSKAIVANLMKAGLSPEAALNKATTALTDPKVTAVMGALKQGFDKGITDATGEYADGKKIPADLPAILTVGAQYTPIDQLRLNAGFHYYFDKQARQYNEHNKQLDRGTIEYSFGTEYDANKWLTVSAGYQGTNYGLTDAYMNDKSFVVSSSSVGGGVAVRLSHKVRLNVAYFHTFYTTKKTDTPSVVGQQTLSYKADYTRKNDVFGMGVDIDF